MRPLTICFPAIRTTCLKRSFQKFTIRMRWHICFTKNLRKSISRITALKFLRKSKGKNNCAISYGIEVRIVLFCCGEQGEMSIAEISLQTMIFPSIIPCAITVYSAKTPNAKASGFYFFKPILHYDVNML